MTANGQDTIGVMLAAARRSPKPVSTCAEPVQRVCQTAFNPLLFCGIQALICATVEPEDGHGKHSTMNQLDSLRAAVGEPHVLIGADAAPYLADWRGRYSGRALAVVRPASTDEVAAVVRLCASAGVPIVPQGGNTSLCGGATPDDSGRAVVLSLQRMNRILGIDPGSQSTGNTQAVA